jgi:phosphoglycolate phosphatase
LRILSLVTIRCQNHIFEDIEAVVFDKDGTLACSEDFLSSLARRRSRLIDAQIPGVQDPLLMAFGITENRLDPTGLMAVGTRLENEIAAAAYVAETGRGWAESVQLVRSAFVEADKHMPRKADDTPLVEGALALIQQLVGAGIKLAILSSDSAENVKAFIHRFELQPYFQASYGVDEQYPNKTNPSLLKQLFVALGVQTQQALMIGDSQVDVEIARSTKMAGCIGFAGGWTSALALPQADVTIEQFSAIKVE